MVFFQLLGCVVGFYFAYKFLEMFITPFVMAIIGAVYISCGKRKEYDAMVEEYKARKCKGGKPFEMSEPLINPSSGRAMIAGSVLDTGGNAYGSSNSFNHH